MERGCGGRQEREPAISSSSLPFLISFALPFSHVSRTPKNGYRRAHVRLLPAREVSKSSSLALLLLGLPHLCLLRPLRFPTRPSSEIHPNSSPNRTLFCALLRCVRFLLVEVLAKPGRAVGLSLHARAVLALLLGLVLRLGGESVGEPGPVGVVGVLKTVIEGER